MRNAYAYADAYCVCVYEMNEIVLRVRVYEQGGRWQYNYENDECIAKQDLVFERRKIEAHNGWASFAICCAINQQHKDGRKYFVP